MLISDEGIKGIVAKIEMKEIQINQVDKENYEIKLDSGVLLGFLAQKLLKEEIQVFEELSGVPGTIGGADEKIYELRKLESHKKYSEEFDIIPEKKRRKEKIYTINDTSMEVSLI